MEILILQMCSNRSAKIDCVVEKLLSLEYELIEDMSKFSQTYDKKRNLLYSKEVSTKAKIKIKKNQISFG